MSDLGDPEPPVGTEHAVLVVDDSPGNLVAVEAAIGDLTPALIKAASGREALRLLLGRDFSLILLDVQMPDMNGFETARLIRQRGRNRQVPIIFVTAFEQTDREVMRGYEIGAVDFLFKPIVPELLRAKVSVFIELRRREQRVRELERQAFDQRLFRERQRWRNELLERRMDEQKRINADLEQAAQQKNDFLAVLGHELRNPLAPIVTALELMKARGLDDPQLDAARDAAERQTRHLVRLVDDLLDISRIERGVIELRTRVRDLRDILVEAADGVVPRAHARGQHVVVDVPQAAVPAEVDEVRVGQIISNLMNNALRCSEDGGTVRSSLTVEDDHAQITITDEGRGIAPEALESIFDAFTRGPGDEGGLGLGLTVVRRLVELHGGTVAAHSEGLGRGSRFFVRLPLTAAAIVRGSPASTPAVSSKKIVVIEDDEDIRLGTKALLETHGHQVEVAADGPSGLSTIRDVRPDVVLVDIGMAEMDGFEVARRIVREHGEGRPHLIAVTGYGLDRDKRRSQVAGFDDHIIKPATIVEIHGAIRRRAATPRER